MTTSPNAILYSAIDGWRVLEDELLAVESSRDLDRMQILMDLSGLGISDYSRRKDQRRRGRLPGNRAQSRHGPPGPGGPEPETIRVLRH
ncbi:hypothetical protein [Arthrobacter sp. NA-172]|uniref:hypothetical protein n=1 Tax=Arthrobacter sp. NA-172 TaxID=3367524 RepID=UPI003754281D